MWILIGCVSGSNFKDSVQESVEVETELDLSGQNVVLFHIDTLRYDRMSLTGYERPTMPLLDELPWMEVEGEYASASWTAPSTASILTGLYPQNHGVQYFQTSSAALNKVLDEETLTQRLKAAGYNTFLASGNGFVSQETGLGAGFDGEILWGEEPATSNLEMLVTPTVAWLNTVNTSQPFFIMLQPFDPHISYSPPEPYLGTWSADDEVLFDLDAGSAEQANQIYEAWGQSPDATNEAIRNLYDEQILTMDAAIRKLIDELDARGLLENTLVVLTSDHGEGLNDENNGLFSHGYSLTEEQLKIPLFFLNPAFKQEKQTCLMENVDLQSTLLTYLKLPVPDVDGQPIQEGCREVARSSLYDSVGNMAQLSVTDGHWRATRNCLNGGIQLNDISGEGEPLPAEETRQWLEEQLDVWYGEIQAAEPNAVCR